MAIQVSRLNEALLVAFSAMSPTNLKAVDQAVRIVRELDRYHGFAASERRLPEAPRAEALAEGPATYGAELMCQARYKPQSLDDMDLDNIALPVGKERPGASAGDARPENPPQAIEKTDSAPGNPGALLPLAPRSPGQEPGEGEGWPPDSYRGRGLGDWSLATIVRKISRKALKWLNPRPDNPLPCFSGERVGVRGLGD